MSKPKPHCVEVYTWLRANLGKGCLGALTGADARALEAAVMIVAVYSYGGDREVLNAFGIVVRQMQEKCWVFAYHAIAMVMDWSDRELVWLAAGLPPQRFGRCEFEPRIRHLEEVGS